MASLRLLECGVFLDATAVPDGDVRIEAQGLCRLMADCIAELVINLSLFELAWSKRAEEKPDHIARRADWAAQTSIEVARRRPLEEEKGLPWGHPEYESRSEEIRLQVRREIMCENWERGSWPESYRFQIPFVHARAFVTTLAMLRNALVALSKYPFDARVASSLDDAVARFAEAFPGLKDIRDSLAHADERVRGLSRGKRIETKPESHPMIEAPNGSGLMVKSLSGNRFGETLADGSYAEVEISDSTTELASAVVQAVYDALPWSSAHRQIDPSN